jgi:hypothetical protein
MKKPGKQSHQDEFTEKILKGMKLAFEKMVKQKRTIDGTLVFQENGKIIKIKAVDFKLDSEK